MFKNFRERIYEIPTELKLFFIIIFLSGLSGSVVNSIFNNFLSEKFTLNGLDRSIVELPREIPGFLTAFVSALLFFLYSRRVASVTFLLQAVGVILMGYLSNSFALTMVWLFFYSLGGHMFFPINSSIAMELAKDGKVGRRLGQSNSIRNMATIIGGIIVFLGFKYLHFNFTIAFTLSAVCLVTCSILFLKMDKGEKHRSSEHMKLHKEYRLYYWLCIIFGARKQIFLTFAPWVIVTVYGKSTQTIAMLLTIGAILGVLYQPILGRTIDKLGEKKVLLAESFILVFACLGYGLAERIFPCDIAFIIVAACFLLDQLSMSVDMARATYLRKISLNPSHIKPTLAMGISLDHIFSISIAVFGGLIWAKFSYQLVFLMGALIAVVNFFSVRMIKNR